MDIDDEDADELFIKTFSKIKTILVRPVHLHESYRATAGVDLQPIKVTLPKIIGTQYAPVAWRVISKPESVCDFMVLPRRNYRGYNETIYHYLRRTP
jgi:hypothetical protein